MSSSYELTGIVHRVGEIQLIKDTFQKREMIVAVEDGNYTQHVTIELTKEKCAELDNYKPGDQVTVYFNLRGRLYTGKDGIERAFTNLAAWKLTKGAQGANAGTVDKRDAFEDVPF
jgi:hypothetical protein